MNYLVYNPLSNNGNSNDKVEEIIKCVGEVVKIDVTSAEYPHNLLDSVKSDDTIYLMGGDGTIMHFANVTYGVDLPKVIFTAGGTGNDFMNDAVDDVYEEPFGKCVVLNKYLKRLPKVTVNGKSYRFINGVGYGIDGETCRIADEMKEKSDKPINYSSIAVKLCLFLFKRRNAKITVDGVTKEYKNVWICPTMKGKFYGGGMIVAPNQDRFNDDGTVSLVVAHTFSRLKILMNFPKLFTGEHTKLSMFDFYVGKKIKVEFSRPCALQIDGEVINDVYEYEIDATC